MKNYEPTPRQSLAIREFVSEAITPLIEDVLVKKLGQAMAFLKEQEQTKREWVGLTDEEIEDEWRLLEAIYLEEVDPEGYYGTWDVEFVRAIEVKLKDKNT